MNARSFNGWTKLSLSPIERDELVSGCPVEDECFSVLSYYAETQDAGVAFIRNLGHRRPKEIHLKFQSYIRQAQSFYKSAQNLHFRSSALLYYYSFLNLAKAFITLKDPKILAKKPRHGIDSPNPVNKFEDQKINVSSSLNEVFPAFYKMVTGYSIKKTSLSIYRLLGYCMDISYENRIIGSRWRSTIPARLAIVVDSPRRQSWPVFILPKFTGLHGYKKAMKPFSDYFQAVDFPVDDALKVFGLTANEASHYDYFESKTEYALHSSGKVNAFLIKNDVFNVVKDLYISEPTKSEFEFCLSVPLRKNSQIPFNEILAIYSVMFFIGSLVRYHPRHLEKMLAKKESWLVERFVNSCPKRLLRYFTNLILNKDHIFFSS